MGVGVIVGVFVIVGEGVRDGVYVGFAPRSTFRANVFRRVRYGIHFMYADDNTFEDNTFEWANSVGLDIGNEDWAASRPPQPVGFDVIRGNTFRYCGIEGLGGTGGPTDTLVERNLFEWIGWQDAAMMSDKRSITPFFSSSRSTDRPLPSVFARSMA